LLVDSAKFENPSGDRKRGRDQQTQNDHRRNLAATWPQPGASADVTNRGQDCIALGTDLVLPKGRKSS
jgi:hypothetical protein